MSETSRKFQKEMNAGTLSLVVLALLERAEEPIYGYEIARRLQAHAGDELPLNQGAIYPVLRSMEKQKLLRSKMQPSTAGPPRKYYALTPAGQKALGQWRDVWRRAQAFVDSVLETDHDSATAKSSRKVSHGARAKHQAKSRSRS